MAAEDRGDALSALSAPFHRLRTFLVRRFHFHLPSLRLRNAGLLRDALIVSRGGKKADLGWRPWHRQCPCMLISVFARATRFFVLASPDLASLPNIVRVILPPPCSMPSRFAVARRAPGCLATAPAIQCFFSAITAVFAQRLLRKAGARSRLRGRWRSYSWP